MGNWKIDFEKYSRNNALMSALMVLLGLVLFIWPGKSLELAARILGIGLLVGAAASCLSWYRGRGRSDAGFAPLVMGALCLIAGIVALSAPKGVVSLLPKLIGIAIIVNGVINMAQAMDLRGAGQSRWLSSLVMAALTVALGLFLLVFAFSAMKIAVMVVGGVLVYNGASNLWIESSYRGKGR